jgi:hypothetical protein
MHLELGPRVKVYVGLHVRHAGFRVVAGPTAVEKAVELAISPRPHEFEKGEKNTGLHSGN